MRERFTTSYIVSYKQINAIGPVNDGGAINFQNVSPGVAREPACFVPNQWLFSNNPFPSRKVGTISSV
ncbi:MAG: hypothetical protein HW407_232 [Bacteroidetes bacterium]|nr:hypothetical protein [Bacteroidota bacterium]